MYVFHINDILDLLTKQLTFNDPNGAAEYEIMV